MRNYRKKDKSSKSEIALLAVAGVAVVGAATYLYYTSTQSSAGGTLASGQSNSTTLGPGGSSTTLGPGATASNGVNYGNQYELG